MKTTATSPGFGYRSLHVPSLVDEAYDTLTESFDQFCPMAGIENLNRLVNEKVTGLPGRAMSIARTSLATVGATRRRRLAFTAARSTSIALGFAAGPQARRCRC